MLSPTMGAPCQFDRCTPGGGGMAVPTHRSTAGTPAGLCVRDPESRPAPVEILSGGVEAPEGSEGSEGSEDSEGGAGNGAIEAAVEAALEEGRRRLEEGEEELVTDSWVWCHATDAWLMMREVPPGAIARCDAATPRHAIARPAVPQPAQ